MGLLPVIVFEDNEARTYKVPFLPKEKIVDGYGAGDGS